MATVKKVKKAQRGGCVSTMSSKERTNFFRGGTEGQLRRAGNKQLRENARAERKEERVEKRAAKKAAKEAPAAKSGMKVKKAQRGGCVSNMSSGERTNFFRGVSEGQIRRANNKMSRQVARDERKEARAEKKAAKKAAPPAKNGKMVKKAVSKKK